MNRLPIIGTIMRSSGMHIRRLVVLGLLLGSVFALRMLTTQQAERVHDARIRSMRAALEREAVGNVREIFRDRPTLRQDIEQLIPVLQEGPSFRAYFRQALVPVLGETVVVKTGATVEPVVGLGTIGAVPFTITGQGDAEAMQEALLRLQRLRLLLRIIDASVNTEAQESISIRGEFFIRL